MSIQRKVKSSFKAKDGQGGIRTLYMIQEYRVTHDGQFEGETVIETEDGVVVNRGERPGEYTVNDVAETRLYSDDPNAP
jgi:hypothetical protein